MPEYSFKEVLSDFFRDTRRYKKPSTIRSEAFHSVALAKYFKGYWLTHSPEGVTNRRKVITGRVVRGYRDFRYASGVQPITVKRELSIASSACKWSISEIDRDMPNPFEGRLISRADQKAWRPRDRTLTQTEEIQLLQCCDPQLREILVFMLDTGLRRSEVVNLTWNRVDMSQALIVFGPNDHKSGDHASCMALGRAYGILQSKEARDGKVFSISDRLLRTKFEIARKRAGLDVNLHDMRRTCGERLRLLYGVEVAQSQLRHKDVRVTERTYAPANVNIVRNALNKIPHGDVELGHFLPAPYSGSIVLQ